jgi:hypothetical protein
MASITTSILGRAAPTSFSVAQLSSSSVPSANICVQGSLQSAISRVRKSPAPCVGAVQEIDAAMHVFARWQHLDLDLSGQFFDELPLFTTGRFESPPPKI